MAVASSYSGTPNSSSGGGVETWDHTGLTISAGSELCLVAFLFTFTNTTTGLSMVWDPSGANQPLTQIGSLDHNVAAYGHCVAFRLVNPVTGNKTLRGNWTGGSFATVVGVAFSGVDQTTPIVIADNVPFDNTTATPSVTVTSSADGATVAMIHSASVAMTSVDNQTQIWLENSLGSAGSYHLGGTSNSHDFTVGSSSRIGGFGVHVAASSSGGSLMGQRTFRRRSR